MEALVSLVLSSALVMLIGTVFMVQSDFYETQLQRTRAQDNARVVTELISSALRGTTQSAITVANDTQLVVRVPLVMGVTCAKQGSTWHSYLPGGVDSFDTTLVSGVGIRIDSIDTWYYYSGTWGYYERPSVDSGARCYNAYGSDTAGIADDFERIDRLDNVHGSNPPLGSLLQFYRQTEFVLTTSTLDPTTIGLFYGTYGETLVEYASGMDTTAAFSYRTGGSTYSSPVTGASSLASIDAVRLIAATQVRAASGGRDDMTSGWTVDIRLRNAN